MKLQMFDKITDKPAGVFDVPDDVLREATHVHDWMTSHEVEELSGLSIRSHQYYRVLRR